MLILATQGSSRQDFTQGSIPRHLIAFSLPMFLGNVLQALYNTVDSIWVGRYLGKEGLASVSVSFPIIFAVVALAMGIGMATTTLVAQYSGARDTAMVRKSIANSLLLTLVVGGLSSALGVIFRRELLALINTPAEIMDWAADYLGIILGGVFATFVYNLVSAVMRGLGDSRTPLKFLAYATVLNIILDPLLIFGIGPFPYMGVSGAALATIIAQAFSGALGIRHMMRLGYLTRNREDWRVDFRLVRLTFGIGLPAGVQQVIVSLGMLTMTSLVNTFGSTVTAAFGVGGRLDQFAFMPAMTMGLAVTALVGQNLGARKFERVKEVVRWSILMTVGITSVVSLVALVFPVPLLSTFTSDPEVLKEGIGYLRVLAFAYIPYALMFMLSGILRGAGDTVPSMLISIVTLWCVRIPLAMRFSKTMGSRGIWLGLAISPAIGAGLNYLYFLSGRWRTRAVTRKPEEAAPVVQEGEPERDV
ncbi:MAG: MATE family efflux transporter [Bacillota bacterium]|nr:MATE family efflux transporter [Candidatus Fermentithermobacillaceae bacterium]